MINPKQDQLDNLLTADLINIDEYCQIIDKALIDSSTVKLPAILNDPTMEKAKQVTLKRVDNIASKKIGILLCNSEYKGVRDPEGF